VPDLNLTILLLVGAGFSAGLISGLSGFAFAMVAQAGWLHILTPLQTTTLTVTASFPAQFVTMWKLRHAMSAARLWPFLLGGALGVPIGAEVLRGANPESFRAGVGILLIAFSVYSLARPTLRVAAGGRIADSGVALLSGMLGGATGLSGILVILWGTARGWPKDELRVVFSASVVAINATAILWFGGTGAMDAQMLKLLALTLPAVLIGTWLGLKLYGRFNEAGFRRLVIGLLLVSGVTLIL
jgi:uncharacterized membrane protein YfcA